MVTDWVGDPGAVVEYGVRFTKPVVVPNDDTGRARSRSAARSRAKLDDNTGPGGPHGDERRPEGAGHVPRRRPARLRPAPVDPRGPHTPPAARRGRPRTLERVQELHDAPLAPLTTFRLGGPATRLITATTDDEVIAAVREADASGTPLLVIGGGSNLVIGDKGFDGTALRIATRGFDARRHPAGAGRGRDLDRRRRPHGRGGPRRHRVPGRNPRLRGRHPDPERRRVRPGGLRHHHRGRRLRPPRRRDGHHPDADCAFSYRHSRFKDEPDRYVVLRVRFELEDAGGLSAPIKYAETARALGVEAGRPGARSPTARETVLALRAGKGMVLDPEDHDTWSAGSFFTNPILDRRARTRPSSPASRTASARTPHRPPSRRGRAGPRPPRPG